jgi:hypothetical protein
MGVEIMINLNRFTETKEIILPIVDNKGIYQGRKFYFPDTGNGWMRVKTGDNPKVVCQLDELEFTKVFEKYDKIKGFIFGSEVVPVSFNTMKQKYGALASSFPVCFMTANPWTTINVIPWEDSNYYFMDIDYSYDDTILKQVKERFDKEQNLEGLKGLTPEMRYLYVLFNLEREMQKELLKKQKEEELKKSLGGRLKLSIENAGGLLIRFTKVGNNRLEVVWSIGRERFNSLIRMDNFMAVSVGYCVSGEDKEYSIAKAVVIAQDFKDKGLIYKKRYL